MDTKTQTKALDLATIDLDDAYTAFWQSRKAKNVTRATLTFYDATAAKFLGWLKNNGVSGPEQVSAREVNGYLSALRDTNASDNTINAHARAIRTMLIYWHENGFSLVRVRFDMPKVGDVVHQTLTFDELSAMLTACPTARDRAIISFMVDTGARRQETANLNWEDVDLKTGTVHIIRGKGRKSRWVGVSPITVRNIINYRRERHPDLDPKSPVFVARNGSRLTGQAILLMFRRLSNLVGFRVHPHALRHTYATHANTSGMSLYQIQQTMGHSDTKTTERYIKSLPSQIVEAQIAVSPMMRLSRRRK
jgi:site-specific recombinase XerD